MKKRQLCMAFFTLLIIAAGTWGMLSVRALLANSTSAGNTSLYLTGTRVIPTIAVSTSTANCASTHIPTPSTTSISAEGNIPPAIKPHLCSVPTFTAQDVRHYMSTISRFSSLRIEQVSPHFTVTRILFVTNQVANDILNADTGITDDSLIVCYVEVYGDFTVDSPFATNKKPPLYHHGQIVFDGITGSEIDMGVEP